MTTNETGKDTKIADKLQDDSAPKAAKPADKKRELTDAEIAAVAGGGIVGNHIGTV